MTARIECDRCHKSLPEREVAVVEHPNENMSCTANMCEKCCRERGYIFEDGKWQHFLLTKLYQFKRDYQKGVIKSFPCPEGYREISFMEEIKWGTELTDRYTGTKVVFDSWYEPTGDLKINHNQYVSHCWYVIKE